MTTPNLKLLSPTQQKDQLKGLLEEVYVLTEHDPRAQQLVEDTLIFVRDSISNMMQQPIPSTTVN